MIRIARGVTRIVFIGRRHVVKLPRFNPRSGRGALWSLAEGVLANLSEAEWSGWPGVCPVKWSLLGVINVYRRCDPVELDDDFDFAAVAPGLGHFDPKEANLGLLDGRLVWVDYAQ